MFASAPAALPGDRGGGLSPEGEWVDVPTPRCLVGVKPLMWEFRKRVCRALKELLEQEKQEQEKQEQEKQEQEKQKQEKQEDATPDNQETFTLPTGTTPRQWLHRLNKVNRQDWDVFIAKPPEDGGPTTAVIEAYLADDIAGGPLAAIRLEASPPAPPPDRALNDAQLLYLKSAPMSASRLEETPEQTGQVTFRWGAYNPDTGLRERDRTETLPVDEFLRRYVQHVPPSGYQTVRHYGLYASGHAKKQAYDRCCALLSDRESVAPPPSPRRRRPRHGRLEAAAHLPRLRTAPDCQQLCPLQSHGPRHPACPPRARVCAVGRARRWP